MAQTPDTNPHADLVDALGACIETINGRVPQGYGQKAVRIGPSKSYGWRETHAMFLNTWGIHVPRGMVLMHTCDNPPCINPMHLRLGTVADNNRDAAAKGRQRNQHRGISHCKRGHEFTAENTYVIPSTGSRQCRACVKLQERYQ